MSLNREELRWKYRAKLLDHLHLQSKLTFRYVSVEMRFHANVLCLLVDVASVLCDSLIVQKLSSQSVLERCTFIEDAFKRRRLLQRVALNGEKHV
jgi:hypothetical protein